jgi:hypothetical protein
MFDSWLRKRRRDKKMVARFNRLSLESVRLEVETLRREAAKDEAHRILSETIRKRRADYIV